MSTKSVLVVDDDPLSLKLIGVMVRLLGHEAYPARSAEEALKLLERMRPAMIVLDARLPGLDGFQLARRIRARPDLDGVPVVGITADPLQWGEMEAVEAGCDQYFVKPIDTRTFTAMLNDYLDGATAVEGEG